MPAIGVFVVMCFGLGILTVWLYAAIRPRLGSGPGTAVCAGLVVWGLAFLWGAIGMGVMGFYSWSLIGIIVIWQLAEMVLAAVIRSSVELAEALAGLVRDMNLGLGTILSHAELLLLYKDEAREKRAGAVAIIQQEAARMRALIQSLGTAAVVSAPHRPPSPAVDAAGAPAASGFEQFLRDVLVTAREPLDAQQISVDLHIPPGTLSPSCPPPTLHRALAETFEGLAGAISPFSQVQVRCERKPVLFHDGGGEVTRDFLMVALAHNGTLSSQDQQRIVDGLDDGPLGQASRLIREMGGFVRFAPLPGGTSETRVFLPAN